MNAVETILLQIDRLDAAAQAELAERLRERLTYSPRDADRIEATPGTCGGDARIRGTRIVVRLLENFRREGLDVGAVLTAFPGLHREDVRAAWRYALEHPEEINAAIRAQTTSSHGPSAVVGCV